MKVCLLAMPTCPSYTKLLFKKKLDDNAIVRWFYAMKIKKGEFSKPN